MNFPEELKYSKDHEWIKIVDGIGYILDDRRCSLGLV